ncbi:MAG: ZIP family metal transporter [Candidatus Paceibacterota bacterium]|jgi:ZIP family zinc transporter
MTYLIYIAIGAVVFTFLGGLFALRFKDKLHLILGFSAGAVLGVAFFDLIPESFELLEGILSLRLVAVLIALGFCIYMVLDRVMVMHSAHEHNCGNKNHQNILGASSLSLHSFIDGLAVGLSFQISTAVGLTVALAVLAHGFSDGINTVNMVLKNGGSKQKAFRWLITDAIAPALGIVVSLLISTNSLYLGIAVALFSGSFLYMGASDLLPESHHAHPTSFTTFATLFGVGLLYVITTIAG